MPNASLCFLVQARLIRSIIIANKQIPIPAAKSPTPISSPIRTSMYTNQPPKTAQSAFAVTIRLTCGLERIIWNPSTIFPPVFAQKPPGLG